MTAFAGGQQLVEEESEAHSRERSDPTLELLATAVLLLLVVLFGVLLSAASYNLVFFWIVLSGGLQLAFTLLAWWNRLCGLNRPWIKVAVGVGSVASFIIALFGLGSLVNAFIAAQG